MLSRVRKPLVATIAATFAIALGILAFGYTSAYADVGSISPGEDITYDKDGGVLKSMGFDTSKMPDDYDPDATTNPYGSDVSTLNEVCEGAWFDLTYFNNGGNYHFPEAKLYGHNNKLNGSYDELVSNPIRQTSFDFLGSNHFVDAVKCDITGDGRDSALAVVYTYYIGSQRSNNTIFLYLCDPATGRSFGIHPIKVGELPASDWDTRLQLDFSIQSQLQIAAGDFDKDSIDEIAVYAPANLSGERNTVQIFDLIDGKECADPFDPSAWQHSWN